MVGDSCRPYDSPAREVYVYLVERITRQESGNVSIEDLQKRAATMEQSFVEQRKLVRDALCQVERMQNVLMLIVEHTTDDSIRKVAQTALDEI